MNLFEKLNRLEDKSSLVEEYTGKYIIVAVTNDRKREFYNATDDKFVTNVKDATIYDDHDLAIDDWHKIDKTQFRRVFVPNYDPEVFTEELTEGNISIEQMKAELIKAGKIHNVKREFSDLAIRNMYNSLKSEMSRKKKAEIKKPEKSIEDHEKDYEKDHKPTCDICGTELADNGTCPECLRGEEGLIDNREPVKFDDMNESSNVSSNLLPSIDNFLQDVAQMYGSITYKDIMEFGERATEADVKALTRLRRKWRADIEYVEDDKDAEAAINRVVADVTKIVKSPIVESATTTDPKRAIQSTVKAEFETGMSPMEDIREFKTFLEEEGIPFRHDLYDYYLKLREYGPAGFYEVFCDAFDDWDSMFVSEYGDSCEYDDDMDDKDYRWAPYTDPDGPGFYSDEED